jgi:putative colanic acid biosynthesis acetyltransferase WcaF
MNKSVKLTSYDNLWYKPGRSLFIRALWLIISALFIQCSWNPSSKLRVILLRLFGAKVGKRVVLKPCLHIKYPWLLSIGDYSWIGEGVWIDNLTNVIIEHDVCISQGAYLLTGNHDYTSMNFNLLVKPIKIESGVWIGAKSIVCPGVICHSHSVLTIASIATKDLPPYTICSGNPASGIKKRQIL